MATHRIDHTWNGGGSNLAASGNYTADGETNRSPVVAEGASNTEVAIAFLRAGLQSISIIPTGPVILKTNSSGSPAETIPIGSWLEWRHDSGITLPFSADITSMFLTDGYVADTTAIHAAVTDNGSPATVTTAITQPLGATRRITATAGGTAGDIKAIAVTVNGTDANGAAQSETLPVFTVNTTGTVNGSLYFATVTSFTIPAHDGTGATTALGVRAETGNGAVAVQIRTVHDATP